MAIVLIATFALGLGVGFLAALPLVFRRGRKDEVKKADPSVDETKKNK
jgi:hypothetical protein